MHLWYDPRNLLSIGRAGGCEVAVLGIGLDLDATEPASSANVDRLAHALLRGLRHFYECADSWAGRFIMLFNDRNKTRICGDPTCMRTLFFSSVQPFIAASHAVMIGERTGSPPNPAIDAIRSHPKWQSPRAAYYPGVITPWTDVQFLTANVALCTENLVLERFAPPAVIPRVSVEEATINATYWMKKQLAVLQKGGRPLILSLTAGIDSRVTLAAARGHVINTSFTYIRPNRVNDVADARVASKVAAAMGTVHHCLHVSDQCDVSILESVVKNNFVPHKPAVAATYRDFFPQEAIHIRSNIGELGRNFWRKEKREETSFSARDLAGTWRKMASCKEAVEAFQEWGDSVGFWNVDSIHPADLAYWEHRLPCWHGCVVLESDIAFESISLFNHRPTLLALLGVPTADRSRSAVFLRIIEKEAPELLAWPINGEMFSDTMLNCERSVSVGSE